MEIVVQRDALVRELQGVERVSSSGSLPITSHVLLRSIDVGSIMLSATDLDTSLRCRCGADVLTPGGIALPAKKLLAIVKSLPEADVRVKTLPDMWATIESGRAKFKLAGMNPEDFPVIASGETADAITFPAATIKALIARVGFAITNEDARYYLAGALMIVEPCALTLVATDGHRLAYARAAVETGATEAVRLLVPRKAVREMDRLIAEEGNVELRQTTKHLSFTIDGRELVTGRIEGQFPAFEKVIDKGLPNNATMDREALSRAITRVVVLSSDKARAVKVELGGASITLTATDPALGEAREQIDAEGAGEVVAIGFNGKYLIEFLGVAGAERVRIGYATAEDQAILIPSGESSIDYRYIVMPVRL